MPDFVAPALRKGYEAGMNATILHPDPGATTRLHRLAGTAERYVILEGRGRAEIGGLPPRDVGPGDVVLIPPGCPQRIANLGETDLVFLAICTPRFRPEAYANLGF